MRRRTLAVIAVAAILLVGTVVVLNINVYDRASPSTVVVGGLKRTYRIYVPASIDKSSPVPLLIGLHGGGGSSRSFQRLTLSRFNDLADEKGFIVVYPDALDRHWNDGRGVEKYSAQRESVDDVAFISALIDKIASEHNIDLGRVYVTGMSNGALMSFRLAFQLSNRIAAIAPVAGAMIENYSALGSPAEPVPVLMINGEEDPLVPWEGGYITFGDEKLGRIISVQQSVQYWVNHNNCSGSPVETWLPDNDPEDGTRVYRLYYGNGTGGAEVILYGIQGGGHAWPGGYQYVPPGLIGNTSRDIDAAAIVWSFFENHSRAGLSASMPSNFHQCFTTGVTVGQGTTHGFLVTVMSPNVKSHRELGARLPCVTFEVKASE